jgi:hypothetical protein
MHSRAARCCLRSDTLRCRRRAPQTGHRMPPQRSTARDRSPLSIRFLLRPAGNSQTLRERAAARRRRRAKLGRAPGKAAPARLRPNRLSRKNPIGRKLRHPNPTRRHLKACPYRAPFPIRSARHPNLTCRHLKAIKPIGRRARRQGRLPATKHTRRRAGGDWASPRPPPLCACHGMSSRRPLHLLDL